MADQKLVVAVLVTHENGWALPKFRLAMHRAIEGVMTVRDELVPDWNRQSRVARLLDPITSAELDIRPLFDIQLIQMTTFDWAFSGVDRVTDADRVLEFAQTWLVMPMRLIE